MLCRKAREVVDNSNSNNSNAPQMAAMTTPTLTLSELDRLCGKSHLISVSDSNPNNNPNNPINVVPALWLQDPNPPGMPFPATSVVWGPTHDPLPNQPNMHPTIAQDLMLFVGFGTEHRLSPTDVFGYPPASIPPDAPEIPDSINTSISTRGSDAFSTPPFEHFQAVGAVATSISQPLFACSSFGPTILDASWQDFVEQLGF